MRWSSLACFNVCLLVMIPVNSVCVTIVKFSNENLVTINKFFFFFNTLFHLNMLNRNMLIF